MEIRAIERRRHDCADRIHVPPSRMRRRPKAIPPNAFKDVVETGTFVKEGLALIAVGLITAVLSRFVPGDDDD